VTERPQTYALDRAVTAAGRINPLAPEFPFKF